MLAVRKSSLLHLVRLYLYVPAFLRYFRKRQARKKKEKLQGRRRKPGAERSDVRRKSGHQLSRTGSELQIQSSCFPGKDFSEGRSQVSEADGRRKQESEKGELVGVWRRWRESFLQLHFRSAFCSERERERHIHAASLFFPPSSFPPSPVPTHRNPSDPLPAPPRPRPQKERRRR